MNASAKENGIITSLSRKTDDRALLFLSFDNGKISNINSEVIKLSELTPEEMEYYSKQEKILAVCRVATVRENRKIGRNELCPCGSGKKYKKCCLK